jgi:hypothetical protein
MNAPQKQHNQWQNQSFFKKHWDAALFGGLAVVSIASDKMGYEPWVSSGAMCLSVAFITVEQAIFQKTRHTLAKSIFIAAMMGNAAYDVYQSPFIQQKIKDNTPPEIAPPTRV